MFLGSPYTRHQLIYRALSKLKKFDHFLQIPQHSFLVAEWTDHAQRQVVAKRVIDVQFARSVGSEEGVVQRYGVLMGHSAAHTRAHTVGGCQRLLHGISPIQRARIFKLAISRGELLHVLIEGKILLTQ